MAESVRHFWLATWRQWLALGSALGLTLAARAVADM